MMRGEGEWVWFDVESESGTFTWSTTPWRTACVPEKADSRTEEILW